MTDDTKIPSNNEVLLPELSPEQEQLLRQRFKLEMGISTPAPQAAGIPLQDLEEFSYTNLTVADLMIPDLGFKLPGGGFEPFVFKPHQTINLRTIYKRREITNSRYLLVALGSNPPQLIKGTPSPDQLRRAEDPLATRARAHSGAGEQEAFADPHPLALISGPGETPFDVKLAELRKKEEEEDRSTRKS